MKYKIILILLSFLFVVASFIPQIWDIHERPEIPKERSPELVHNYLFDYNFYLSRIREGLEGRWVVIEKYYNFPHTPSLLQIVYVYFGKIGGLFGLGVEEIYHAARFIFGFFLLLTTSLVLLRLFLGFWAVIGFLLITTAGSWPIILKIGNGWRSATYMGWWSAIDSLQRIAFIPHILIGQLFLLLFVYHFGTQTHYRKRNILMWGILGLVCGIIFPPTILIIYVYFVLITLFEIVECLGTGWKDKIIHLFWNVLYGRFIFILFTIPPLLYLQIIVKTVPWSALPLMDIMHRINLPYNEYVKALGPVLPIGVAGLLLALIRQDKKMLPFICWALSVLVLFIVFEHVPQQSPLRFTEAAIHIPLGILTTYLFVSIAKINKWSKRGVLVVAIIQIITGLFVMYSMVGWLTDQVYSKRIGTWSTPLGVQLVYPLKDFMDGIMYIKLNTNINDVILTYITAGNYIPAYTGNYVYIGHINTPDEDMKEGISAKFFSGKMDPQKAVEFIKNERISYIYFGPQEKELAYVTDLKNVYKDLPITPVYTNSRVVIYKVLKTN